jgi:signal transduction histidine kinase
LALHQGVNLVAPPPPNLPPILVDEPSLDRVLANLLVNALAATPRGGEIRVEAHPGADRREVELIVADTGSGLSPGYQEHLFEKYRLSGHKHDGSGLGLYICKTLVEANQGRIWAESCAGQGAVFHLALPAVPEAGAEPGLEEPPVVPGTLNP